MNTYLRYYDERFGDVYEVYLTNDGEFLSAMRSVEQFGRGAIYYDSIDAIPVHIRATLEHLIDERKKTKNVG